MTTKMVADKEDLIRLQDYRLQRFMETKPAETRKGYEVSFEKTGEIWEGMRQRKDEAGDIRKQLLVALMS